MLCVLLVPILKQESVSLVTKAVTALTVTPESVLVLEGDMMTPTRVETKQRSHQIMETNTSKPWDISWCSERNCLYAFCNHFCKSDPLTKTALKLTDKSNKCCS